METTTTQTATKQGGSKKFIAIIIAAVLLIGGSVAAYALLNKSAKEKYFLAEKDSLDVIVDSFKDKYEPEISWAEKVKTSPTVTNLKLGMEMSDEFAQEIGEEGSVGIINSSSLLIKSSNDPEKLISNTEVSADFLGTQIGGLNLGIEKDEISLKLPFVEDTLLVKEKDFAKLISQLDPEGFSGEELADFSMIFDPSKALPEEDQEYLKKEYLGFFYNELSDDVFEAKDEKVKVDGNEVSAEKITLTLSEKQTKELLTKYADKAAKDDRLKEIMRKNYSVSKLFNLGSTEAKGKAKEEADELIKEFENGLKDLKEELNDVKLPNGIKSTIWVNDGLIVKRDFAATIEPKDGDSGTITLNGTQDLKAEEQKLDYKLGVKDSISEEVFDIKGHFTNKDGKINDQVDIGIDEGKLVYKADESLKDGKRKFTRTFNVSADGAQLFTIDWEGNDSYKKDSAESKNELNINLHDLGGNIGKVKIDQDSEVVDSVKPLKKEKTKDIGSMSLEEIITYFNEDVYPAIMGEFAF